MKAVGIVRKVDDLGRIVIPKELRESKGIDYGDALEIFVDEFGNIILRKYSVTCSECGEHHPTLLGKSKVCPSCLRKLNAIHNLNNEV